ncbi:MAG: hypothetical protein E7321_07945 [Clostridiales bacterium]|nr:hypothetical protein [Clostridiales bacterium]
MKHKKWLPSLALLLAALLLWACFHGRGQRIWENLQDSRLVFENGYARSENAYGEMNSGPALSVGGGTYTLIWDIETDADNLIHVRATNQAAIEPKHIVISAGQAQGSATFASLDEIYDLQIVVDYQAGSSIKVNRIDLVGHRNTDGLFTLTFALLAAGVLCALHAAGWLTPKRRGAVVVVMLAVLLAAMPDLRGNLCNGHDGEFHMARLLNLVHGLRNGQFPVRLSGYMQNGYGAIVSAYYPELFMYIPACMILLGASFTYSFHVLFVGMHLASALTMWYAASKLFKCEKAGVAASVLYTLSQYRVMDIYTRFAVGEALAMCFLPLFTLGLYEVIWGDRRRWKLLAVSAALICQSHVITTAICGAIAVAVGLLSLVQIVRGRRVAALIKAVLAALGLNAFFFAPMYTYSQQGAVTSWLLRDLTEHTVSLAQLLIMPDNAAAIHEPHLQTSAIGLGLPLVVMGAAALYAALTKEKRSREDWIALVMCAAGVILSLMTTNLFPWGLATRMTNGMAAYIQFPWRLLTFASACLAFAGGYAVSQMKATQEAALQFALVALCAVCVMPLLSQETREYGFVEKGSLPYWDVRYGDYALPRANLRALDEKEPIVSEGIVVDEFDQHSTTITARVSAQQDGTVIMPLYAFDGYVALLDGAPLAIERSETEHMQLALNAGMEGELRIWFEGKAYWKVFDGVSLATLLGMLWLSVSKRKRAKA